MLKSRLAPLLIASLAVAGCQQAVSGQAQAPEAIHSPDRVRADLAYLRDAVVRRHPRFHAQAPDAELIRAFDEAARSIHSPMTRAQAFRVVARVNPAFKDAHTLLLPTFAAQDRGADPAPFPIAVRLGANGELTVAGDWLREGDGPGLASGTVIRSINGVASAQLLDELSAYGHGETAPLRRHMLTLMFPDWLAAVRQWSGTFHLELEHDGRSRKLDLSVGDAWKPRKRQALLDRPNLSDLGDGIALLRLPTFDVDDDPKAYRAAVDRAFAAIRRSGATDLVLDVRGNTGGQSEAGAQVIRYLIARPVNQVSRARERLNDDNRGWFGYKGRAGEMREMDLTRDGMIEPAAQAQRFEGRVALLVDAMTYSAGILFATTLQDHGLAVLIGQPTAGYANQTGNMEPVRLPNTGLMAYIPAREFVRPSGDARIAHVVPDLPARLSTTEADDALSVAMAHLRAQRRNNTVGNDCGNSAAARCHPRADVVARH